MLLGLIEQRLKCNVHDILIQTSAGDVEGGIVDSLVIVGAKERFSKTWIGTIQW